MIVVFSPIFVADTEIIFGYNFEALLKAICSFENVQIHAPTRFLCHNRIYVCISKHCGVLVIEASPE